MATVSGTFTATGQITAIFTLRPRQTAAYSVVRTGSGAFAVRLLEREGAGYTVLRRDTADATATIENPTDQVRYLAIECQSVVPGDSIAASVADNTGESIGPEFFNSAGARVFAVTEEGISADVVGDVTGDSAGTHTGAVVPPALLGTAGTGVTAVVNGAGNFRTIVLTLTNVALPIVSVTTGNGVGGVTLYTFPEGYVYVLGTVAALTWAVPASEQADFTDATPEGQMGIGTLAPANADALGTDATDDNLATAADITGSSFAGAVNLASEAPLAYDGSATAMPVVLTGLIDAADIDDDATSSINVSGTVTINAVLRGDVTAP